METSSGATGNKPAKKPDEESLINRKILTRLEFVKLFCLLVGFIGFLIWIGDLVYLFHGGDSIHPIFNIALGPIPVLLIFFSIVLFLGTLVATLEKKIEAKLISLELEAKLNPIRKTLSEISSQIERGRKLEEELNQTKKLNKELKTKNENSQNNHKSST
jgi:hypothetical protein